MLEYISLSSRLGVFARGWGYTTRPLRTPATVFMRRWPCHGKTWCVAQSQATEPKLQQVLDYLCGQLDCKEIPPGGSCFNPNTVRNHASYAIDLNFQINGVCDISYATTAITDRSFGTCVYP
ncbi:unnamed protein product [Lactuca saligna]|uniref:X8 domain-containing protein n=1 Tax=Lactuca saligna TaxID=75948 RepID=A0AA35Z565_LACSI|nr:unnamed protein product [Lactuca saligna]